ncbi:hypothetical protein H6F67_04515 [Microcoleus sp. FACHB-1515]|uniref:hypothetical protein n=1 Tax=Cyanophyceae TaxID=3028117 RepID=UPI001689DEE9|nr:hypothetical protein [Microcoleus sp. FACHB-1515]MBD2089117.1 hypothetical protein [Microcoleus sp. FACHB-1515]
MDRRVFGGGAIVCSAMVLWSQPSAPDAQKTSECDEGTTACTATTARPAQPQPSILPPDINRAIESLSNWGGGAGARLPDSMESVYADLLERGQAAASESKLSIALSTVSGIPTNSQHYAKASQLRESWAQELLERGNSQYQQGDMGMALSMLIAIPPTSDRYERAQELLERWSQQAVLLNRAEAARKEGDWQSVMAAIESLEGTPIYDSLPVQQLLQQSIYRAYGSDAALRQLTDSSAANGSVIPAIPTDQAAISTEQAAPNAALPNLPDLPIDVNQALVWAQPSSPVTALPQPVPMPIAPSRRATPQPPAATPMRATAPAVSGSIAPPESMTTATIDKNATSERSRPSLSDNHNALVDPKLTK